MFETCMQKGVHITFANGLTASIQWGAGNYCDNYFPKDMDFSTTKPYKSPTAEVAVIDHNGDLLDGIRDFLPEGVDTDNMIAGYITPEQVVYFLQKIAEYKI